ncbi:MAG TPA: DegT/DnrJ/EryC1/StrS family aminotransferase [Candidatus Polarisedimenticolia bacterium]|nr:DegT/DnrJ/EryC1/StrS family aminotransferase [Candidatus Polarisedimenticolia bacterium]
MELAVRGGKPVVSRGLAVRWPVIGGAERQAALEVLDSGVLCGSNAPQLKALEAEFARFVGARFCLATNSGTAALHMAVAAAGIGAGDEVITSAFTYPASALAVLQHNAVPIFADIDPVTFNIDPARIEERISSRTRGIMPVHIHGLPCDMDRINAIARRRGLVVIEDAAQAHGATYRSRQVGTLGDMAAFSLNATKNLPCGEGGLFVTDSDKYAAGASSLRILGQDRDDAPFDPIHPLDSEGDSEFAGMGWMYLTQEIPAAIARAQLRRLVEFNQNAAGNAGVLTSRLSALPGVTPPRCPDDRTHVYHKYRVRLDPRALGLSVRPEILRDRVLAALRAEGVEVRLWLGKPVPEMEIFQTRTGYGHGCPWSCHGGEVRYGLGEHPMTTALIADSLVLGSQSYPLFPQPRALMEQYADAFEKVIERVADLPDPGTR